MLLLCLDAFAQGDPEFGHAAARSGLILPERVRNLQLVFAVQQRAQIVERGLFGVLHAYHRRAAARRALKIAVFVPLAAGRHAVHFGAAGAVHQPAARIIRFPSGLFSLVHDPLHLHKLRLVDDNRQGVFNSNRIRLAAPCAPVRFLCGAVCVNAGVLFVSQHFVYLRVPERLAAFPDDSGGVHLGQQRRKPAPVCRCIEDTAHIARFQFVDDVPAIHNVVPKRRASAVVQAVQRVFPVPFAHFFGQIVNIVFRQRPHQRLYDLRFLALPEVLRRGDQLHAFVPQPGFQVDVFADIPGDAVIFVDENHGKAAVPCVPEQLLILFAAGRRGALAADRLVGIHRDHIEVVRGGVFPAGADLRVDAFFALLVGTIPGVYRGLLHGAALPFFDLLRKKAR